MSGDVHTASGASSNEQRKVASSEAEKVKLGVESLPGSAGPESIEVSGASVSIVHVKLAALASSLPAASTAATVKVCSPSPSPEWDTGLGQGVATPASSTQAKLEPGSFDANEKLASGSLVSRAGDSVIEVSGATVSIVQVWEAAEASSLPAASVAVTVKVCSPSASPEYGAGLAQGVGTPSSREHVKLAALSVEVKEKLAPDSFMSAAGPVVIDVSGATVSIVHAKLAAVASSLPAASAAVTVSVCSPSSSPV